MDKALHIARYQPDRAQRVPGITTVEEPLRLAQAVSAHSRPDMLISPRLPQQPHPACLTNLAFILRNL